MNLRDDRVCVCDLCVCVCVCVCVCDTRAQSPASHVMSRIGMSHVPHGTTDSSAHVPHMNQSCPT